MSHLDIVNKINDLLGKYTPFTEEYQVVYFLVEIRKIMDRESGNYPLLRFYADWVVHTQKDKITPQIKAIMEEIYEEIIKRTTSNVLVMTNPPLTDFAIMGELRKEIDKFLQDHGLSDSLVVDMRVNWPALQGFLAKILTDQPIINPCEGIDQFSFVPSAPGCVLGEVIYKKPDGNKDLFKFGGAY